jgi:dTDP-4-dehydrorhamnose 3,5-epimerase
MQIHDTCLPEVKRIALDVFSDARGFFVERFHQDKFRALGLDIAAVQLNHSRSNPRVIRGLHFQHTPMQGKLVGVTHGAILDIAVDIRPTSANFGKFVAVELNEKTAELLWIPGGFAHGFAVLGDTPADVVYHMDAAYAPAGESGIAFDDPALAITWPYTRSEAILSPRDLAQPSLAEATPHLTQWFQHV